MYQQTLLSRCTAALFALAAGLNVVAKASLMDFETASEASFLTAPFIQDGIQLSRSQGHYDLHTCNLIIMCPLGNGIVAGLDSVQTGPATVRIALLSGSFFNLDSIQILNSDRLSFIQSPSGSSISSLSPGTYTGLAGFQGIQFFDITSNVDIAGGFLFDNIAVSAVPEPTTFELMLLPGVMLMVFGRIRPSIPA